MELTQEEEKKIEVTAEQPPVSLVHFTQPWSQKFAQGFDTFFDAFSNTLIFFKEGYFVVWDQFDRSMVSGI